MALPWLAFPLITSPSHAARPLVGAAGMLLGACALIPCSLQLFPLAALAHLLLCGLSIGSCPARVAALVVTDALTIAPWKLHSMSALGEPVPIAPNGGGNL